MSAPSPSLPIFNADRPPFAPTATLGPVIGGYLAGAGWRWNYYLIIIVSGLLLIADIFFLPETTPSTILQHRAVRLRKETGDNSYVTEQERHRLPLGTIVYNALVVPIQLFVTEPIMMCAPLPHPLPSPALYCPLTPPRPLLFKLEDA